MSDLIHNYFQIENAKEDELRDLIKELHKDFKNPFDLENGRIYTADEYTREDIANYISERFPDQVITYRSENEFDANDCYTSTWNNGTMVDAKQGAKEPIVYNKEKNKMERQFYRKENEQSIFTDEAVAEIVDGLKDVIGEQRIGGNKDAVSSLAKDGYPVKINDKDVVIRSDSFYINVTAGNKVCSISFNDEGVKGVRIGTNPFEQGKTTTYVKPSELKDGDMGKDLYNLVKDALKEVGLEKEYVPQKSTNVERDSEEAKLNSFAKGFAMNLRNTSEKVIGVNKDGEEKEMPHFTADVKDIYTNDKGKKSITMYLNENGKDSPNISVMVRLGVKNLDGAEKVEPFKITVIYPEVNAEGRHEKEDVENLALLNRKIGTEFADIVRGIYEFNPEPVWEQYRAEKEGKATPSVEDTLSPDKSNVNRGNEQR